jgi:hypothetical protein
MNEPETPAEVIVTGTTSIQVFEVTWLEVADDSLEDKADEQT